MLEKLVLVTRKTRLQELIERFNSRGQVRFYVEHAGGNFTEYDEEDRVYRSSLETVTRSLDVDLKLHVIDRALVPTYLFSPRDLVMVLGQDGLVANVAKYTGAQPIVGVNPDPARNDGVLLPYRVDGARTAVLRVVAGRERIRPVSLAEAVLNDGQRLLAFNDLYLGVRSHTSARYRIVAGQTSEVQSSSGIVVSTGAGSTGWMSSIFQMAGGIARAAGLSPIAAPRLSWEDRRLVFAVREPFPSKHSQATLVTGLVEEGAELEIESLTPTGGVIFSDGIEADFVEFNSGTTARVRAADQRACLAVPP